MNIATAKLLIAVAIFLISLGSAVAPLRVISLDDNFFSFGNLLASGVLLAAGLVHQLPDSMENLQGLAAAADFPLAAFIAGLTFCCFLMFEEFMHTEFEDSNPFEEGHGHNHSHDHGHISTENHEKDNRGEDMHSKSEEEVEEEIKRLLALNAAKTGKDSNDEIFRCSGSIYRYAATSASYAVTSATPINAQISHDTYGSNNTRRSFPDARAGIVSIRKTTTRRPSLFDAMRNETFEFEHPVHHHDDHLASHTHGSLLASLILLCALSVHSIFDGLAIGIASNMSDVVGSTAAVFAHKAFAGYAVGSAMVASEMKNRHFYVLCFAFAGCSVFGIFLGMIFEQLNNAQDSSPTGIVQAMVAGTFLYVSIVEIGMKEMMMHRESSSSSSTNVSHKAAQWGKLGSFLMGYLLMSLLAIWI